MKVKNKILAVIFVTIITMFAEITFGFITNSMALLADGFHMGTHAFALGLTYIAYFFCEKYKDNAVFKSGTGKINELAGYTSSLFLGLSGILIIAESVQRVFSPQDINYTQATVVIIIGLVVNAISILIMDFEGIHSHKHNCDSEHGCDKRDNNFKSAYFHILADLLTSIFALVALLFARYFGLVVLDPITGILGGTIILKWAWNLIKSTAANLLDLEIKTAESTDNHE